MVLYVIIISQKGEFAKIAMIKNHSNCSRNINKWIHINIFFC